MWLCGHACIRAGAHRVRKTVLRPPEVGLQATVNCQIWVLGAKLGSFARVSCALDHRVEYLYPNVNVGLRDKDSSSVCDIVTHRSSSGPWHREEEFGWCY